jgi:hypothetical protein
MASRRPGQLFLTYAPTATAFDMTTVQGIIQNHNWVLNILAVNPVANDVGDEQYGNAVGFKTLTAYYQHIAKLGREWYISLRTS